MATAMIEKPDSVKLTLKERKFIKAYIETGNKSKAAQMAGYKNIMSAWDVLENPRVQAAIEMMMDKKGLSDGELLDGIAEGTKANKVISANIYYKNPQDPNAPVEDMKESDGVTKDFIEVPDWGNRHKFLETALELRRRLDKIVDPSQGQLVVNGNVTFVQAMIQRSKEFR